MIHSAALGLSGLFVLAAAPVPPAQSAPPAPVAAPAAPDAPRSPAGAAPAAPHVIIIRDGKVITDGTTAGSNVQVITTGDSGKGGKQIKTIIMTRGDGDGTTAAKRIIVRCFKKAKLVDGKPVVTEASKDCETIDMPDVEAITADAMQHAGVEIAMIRPTIEHALQSARVAIVENRDLSADQRSRALAGIDTAIKETMKDKLPVK